MGLFDRFLNNKIKEPIFYNEHEDTRIQLLDELIDKVGDNQKQILEEEKKYVQIGLSGEKNVIYELKRCINPIVFIHDVTIQNGFHDSQIDFIIITRKGLLVLETKKLIGDITIDNEGNFIRYFKNAKGEVYKKEGIYSPITQNTYHVNALRRLFEGNRLYRNLNIESLVVIANTKTIINKKYAPSEIKKLVIKHDQLNTIINDFVKDDRYSDLNDNKMLEIAEIIVNSDTKKSIDYVSKFNLEISDNIIEDIQIIDELSPQVDIKSDDELYETLRKYRYSKSKELNIQPWMIFNNDVLGELVLNKPHNKEEFIKINGLGESKFNSYGIDILNIINDDILEEGINQPKELVNDDIKSRITSQLKQYRYKKSQELNYKPYFIFNNAELESIVNILPRTKEELLSIKGFGEKKIEMYGNDIIQIINKNINK